MKTKGKPSPIDMQVGMNLRVIRMSKGRTQVELAEALGITFQQVQKYEWGKNRISAGHLYTISKYLKTPIKRFYQGVE